MENMNWTYTILHWWRHAACTVYISWWYRASTQTIAHNVLEQWQLQNEQSDLRFTQAWRAAANINYPSVQNTFAKIIYITPHIDHSTVINVFKPISEHRQLGRYGGQPLDTLLLWKDVIHSMRYDHSPGCSWENLFPSKQFRYLKVKFPPHRRRKGSPIQRRICQCCSTKKSLFIVRIIHNINTLCRENTELLIAGRCQLPRYQIVSTEDKDLYGTFAECYNENHSNRKISPSASLSP